MRSRPRTPTADADLEPAEDLLARFRDGDAAAFDAIVATYEARVVNFFFRLCWDRDRAEDFAQMLFIKLLRGAPRYRPEGKLSTFLFRVATNLWIDHYRSTRPRGRLYSLDQAMLNGMPVQIESDVEQPDTAAERREEKERLRTALEELTEPHRLVFELAVYQEMPYAQIGEVLGIPVGTVKSRMHNSVKALKEILAREQSRPAGRSFRAAGGAVR